MQKKAITEKLLTVEILCYGVPSPQIWADYIDHLEKKYGKLLKYSFRDERDGWSNSYYHCANFENGTELYRTKELQAFASLFGTRANMRESCFNCRFSSMHRCADITIGDCWGIEHIDKGFADSGGVSQVMINTEKGRLFWNTIREHFDIVDVDLDRLAQYNSVLSYPAKRPDEYNAFWGTYEKRGFDAIMKKYTRLGKTFRIRRILRMMIYSIYHRFKSQLP